MKNGFTILEALVATFLTSVVMSVVYVSTLSVQDGYINDVYRTRINSNLRSAMDILSMNIRQAGEYLQSSFPAVVVTNGSGTQADQLQLRRSLIPETLTLCTASTTGDTELIVSSGSISESACYVNNVASSYDVFEARRVSDSDGSIRLFVYDRIAKVGEFVDFTASTLNGSEYTLTVSATTHDYARLDTSLYVVEELSFYHDSTENTLFVDFDGVSDSRAVAFNVSDFQVSLEMEDGSNLSSFDSSSAYNWKQITQVQISLTGEETLKLRTVSSSVSSEYFPRNVLSFD